MKLIDVTRQFKSDDDCLDYIEKMRWPNGEIGCVHCGEIGRVSTITRQTKGDNKRTRIFQCLACGKQFSATSGTIFNDTHLPLTKWFHGDCDDLRSEEGHVCIAATAASGRELPDSLASGAPNPRSDAGRRCLLTGVVEVDETYVGGKVRRKGKPFVKKDKKDVVLGLIERGGQLRLVPVADSKMTIIEPVIEKHISPDATLQTDESSIYHIIGKRRFPGRHRVINHSSSYGFGENHSNTIENAFSLLKRGDLRLIPQGFDKALGPLLQ